jgi:hypothetical protein
LRAYLGERAEYRRLCEGMVKRFARGPGELGPRLVAWTCGLAPGALADPSEAVRAGERAVARAPQRRASHNALGAALHRAGRWQDAVRSQTEASRLAGGAGTAEEWVFLALSHACLGEKDQARRWLRRVADAAARAAQSASPPHWADRLDLELLRREAEALLR